ncbi:ABC transporter substrate-binding protein [Niveibacterium sp. 24ML]|uniref:TAXI family TRAP transporter solute-binding subunit n=1 Tax=Niveibacterium sp. 24ML TaxID=2985512 RepID=UPI00226E4998|nr:TAXI family TRAP transporter solute-binding subunit [Niveibacterium sp. 24ML]MCX9158319.1 ABC transporter substrate-binding protein [Niveibacterium sp. 24ML]
MKHLQHLHGLRRVALWLAIGMLALLAGVLVVLHFFAPMPPRTLTMSTGTPGGAYAYYGERYREILARQGVKLILQPSSGTIENLRRLKGVDGQADVSFLQGGIVQEPESDDLYTLGAVYYEPVWIFIRDDIVAERISDLRGKRIAIGAQGGGAQLLALEIANANGFATNDPSLIPIGGDEAIHALERKQIDALVTVNGAHAPIVQQLLRMPGIRPLGFTQADAYTRLMPHLTRLVLPRGAIDLVNDKPAADLALVAPTANLVVRKDLHPALVALLMQAASEIHRKPGLFEKGNEFPAARDHELPPSPEATRFYRSGPPLLQRILPFGAAVLVDRLMWTLLPLLAVLIPAFRILPALHRWHMRSRIYRWYGELKFLEEAVRRGDASQANEWRSQLESVEERALRCKVPLAYANELYILREHIALVRDIIASRAHPATHEAGATTPQVQD